MRQPDITPRSDSERLRKPERLSKDAINTLPLFYYEGQIEVIRTPEGAQAAASVLQSAPVLGFDTETRPSFRKGKTYPPSLVQFAVPDRVYIFQLSEVSLEGPLAEILGNSRIYKVGVAIQDDCRFLAKLHPFAPAGLVDLGGLARRGGVAEQGLRGLAAHFLGLRISKGEQCSNWSVKNLTPKQIRYAATDAWVSLEVYRRMAELGFPEF